MFVYNFIYHTVKSIIKLFLPFFYLSRFFLLFVHIYIQITCSVNVCVRWGRGGVFYLQLVVKEKFWYDAALFPDLRREKDLHRKQTMLQHLLIE